MFDDFFAWVFFALPAIGAGMFLLAIVALFGFLAYMSFRQNEAEKYLSEIIRSFSAKCAEEGYVVRVFKWPNGKISSIALGKSDEYKAEIELNGIVQADKTLYHLDAIKAYDHISSLENGSVDHGVYTLEQLYIAFMRDGKAEIREYQLNEVT